MRDGADTAKMKFRLHVVLVLLLLTTSYASEASEKRKWLFRQSKTQTQSLIPITSDAHFRVRVLRLLIAHSHRDMCSTHLDHTP